jgi:predicted Rossmann fold nucleotide-binding protein DprA/Smf involved in DNA uptake
VTDPVMNFSDDPNADGVHEEQTARRGRPRSPETIQRDQSVLKALTNGPRTKEQLVEELKLKDTHVYLSLWRLRRDGEVERYSEGDTRHLWRVSS